MQSKAWGYSHPPIMIPVTYDPRRQGKGTLADASRRESERGTKEYSRFTSMMGTGARGTEKKGKFSLRACKN